MANKMPSMLALLGLLAVAGYQNRDKISEALDGLKNRTPSPDGKPREGLDGILDGLGGLLGGAAGGGGLAGGLGDLMDTFKKSGQADVADSWVTPGVPTKGLTPNQVEQAIGALVARPVEGQRGQGCHPDEEREPRHPVPAGGRHGGGYITPVARATFPPRPAANGQSANGRPSSSRFLGVMSAGIVWVQTV